MSISVLVFDYSLIWVFLNRLTDAPFFVYRWPNALEADLDDEVRVIKEGHNGRTAMFDDPVSFDNRNGAIALSP